MRAARRSLTCIIHEGPDSTAKGRDRRRNGSRTSSPASGAGVEQPTGGGHDGREGWAATAPPGSGPCRPGSRWARRNGWAIRRRAPSASAMCRHASRCGVERGRCRTTRRTERTTWTPSFSSRSRSHVTLAAGTRSTRRPQSQFLHEHVGRGGQEDAQLVRREQTAARAVDLQPIEQFLDPILDVPASTVDLLIDEARRLPQIRHHEPRVVPRLAVSEANDFGLGHDPALVVPTCGRRSGCRYRRARSRHRPRSARGPPAWRTADFAEVDHRFRGCGSRISVKWSAHRSVATFVGQLPPIGVVASGRYPTRAVVSVSIDEVACGSCGRRVRRPRCCGKRAFGDGAVATERIARVFHGTARIHRLFAPGGSVGRLADVIVMSSPSGGWRVRRACVASSGP